MVMKCLQSFARSASVLPVGTKSTTIPPKTAAPVPTVGGLFLSQDRVLISDEPPPSGRVPAWVTAQLARVRHRANPSILMPHSISRTYGSADGTSNE